MTSKSPPWKTKKTTKGASKTKLTPAQIEWAKERAKKAGRPYPNLIDNMAAAREAKKSLPVFDNRIEDDFPNEDI